MNKRNNKNEEKLSMYSKILSWFVSSICFLIFLSLLSYSQKDPSFFVATDSTSINNLLGKHGAFIASLFLETIGYSVIIILLFLTFYIPHIRRTST